MRKGIEWLKEKIKDEEHDLKYVYDNYVPYEKVLIADDVHDLIDQLDELETLSKEWIDENKVARINDLRKMTTSDVVPVEKLKNLLVPKQDKQVIPQFVANRIEEERAKIKTFYTSDTHFNQQRTHQYSLRDQYFESAEQATEEMIRRWNSVVSAEDTVMHLGDFGDFEVAKRLNGNIILLFGNYERDGIFTPTQEEKDYFHAVFDCIGIGEDYLMVHEPENRKDAIASILKDKGVDYTDTFYLFGHIHEKQKVKRNGLNVGVDVHNFTPVSRETVEFYRIAVQNIYDDNCFENY